LFSYTYLCNQAVGL